MHCSCTHVRGLRMTPACARVGARSPMPSPVPAPQVSRASYRQQRLSQYRNYTNLISEQDWDDVRRQLVAGWPQPPPLPPAARPYAFARNWRSVGSSVVHFQLRNLLWAPSAHDVVVVHDNRLQHFNTITRAVSDVLDLRGQPKGPRIAGLGRVQVRPAHEEQRRHAARAAHCLRRSVLCCAAVRQLRRHGCNASRQPSHVHALRPAAAHAGQHAVRCWRAGGCWRLHR